MIPLPDLKLAAKVEHDADDSYLVNLEAAAVAYVQRKTGWYWGEEAEAVMTVEGGGGGVLWLPEKVTAVTSVVSQPYEGGDQTTITAGADDGYALRLAPGETHGMRLIRKGGVGWAREYEYVVTGTIGYDEAVPVPDDIRQAVSSLAVLWYEQRLPVALGSVAPPVPNHVAAILEARRRRRVA